MRIIAGKYQRRIIHPPPNLPVRPTTDLAKEALFNVLNHHFGFEGLNVIDLFSGTGSMAYEFASRGANEVIAVDANFKCYEFISKTIRQFEFKNMKAVRADVFRFLSYCRPGFDIFFADPPYDMEGIERIPEADFSRDLLKPGGWLILEHPAGADFTLFPQFKEERKYGKVHFSFFVKPATE